VQLLTLADIHRGCRTRYCGLAEFIRERFQFAFVAVDQANFGSTTTKQPA
jgi:hypothetical protein